MSQFTRFHGGMDRVLTCDTNLAELGKGCNDGADYEIYEDEPATFGHLSGRVQTMIKEMPYQTVQAPWFDRAFKATEPATYPDPVTRVKL